MKLPTLEAVLTRMREEIEDKANLLKRVMSPHRFPCPICAKEVAVNYKPDGVSYNLRHPQPLCSLFPLTKDTRPLLLEAFVFHCRPALRYGALEGLEGNSLESESKKHLGEKT